MIPWSWHTDPDPSWDRVTTVTTVRSSWDDPWDDPQPGHSSDSHMGVTRHESREPWQFKGRSTAASQKEGEASSELWIRWPVDPADPTTFDDSWQNLLVFSPLEYGWIWAFIDGNHFRSSSSNWNRWWNWQEVFRFFDEIGLSSSSYFLAHGFIGWYNHFHGENPMKKNDEIIRSCWTSTGAVVNDHGPWTMDATAWKEILTCDLEKWGQ